MAVVNITEDKTREITREGKNMSLQTIFHVDFDGTDSIDDEVFLALQASITTPTAVSIPKFHQKHPTRWLFVMNKEVKQEGPHSYGVFVKYANIAPMGGLTPGGEAAIDDLTEYPINPTDEPAVSIRKSNTSNEKIDKAYDEAGNLKVPITNSSRETFASPITEDFYDGVFTDTKIVDLPRMMDLLKTEYRGTVNNQIFKGYDAGEIKCTDLFWEYLGPFILDDNSVIAYFQMSIDFHCRIGGWKRKILDEGFRVLTGSEKLTGSAPKRITDSDGNPVSEPALLDGHGALLTPGADAVFLEFTTKQQKDFSVFGD